jgi:pimeloyl-ACP methyl ester carboxylesterase
VAPTLIIFGARDVICSTRFAEPLKGGMVGVREVVFDHLSHAGVHEDLERFNRATLEFLLRQRS